MCPMLSDTVGCGVQSWPLFSDDWLVLHQEQMKTGRCGEERLYEARRQRQGVPPGKKNEGKPSSLRVS